MTAVEVARAAALQPASNGLLFATHGDLAWPAEDIARILGAVPQSMTEALRRHAYYFVELVLDQSYGETPLISPWSKEMAEHAICHRNFAGSGSAAGSEMVFISSRLMQDKFALAFEFFINAAHGFVDAAGVAPDFAAMAWRQAEQNAKGETSVDAWESRKRTLSGGRVDEKAKSDYLESAFSDALAVYMLSMAVDVDYFELREREYPLLAPRALGERLNVVAAAFPPNPGYEFSIRYRRRG